MKIKYTPQRADFEVTATIVGEVITLTVDGVTDVFDFSQMPNGESGEIETVLPANPILRAERIDGELIVHALSWYGPEPVSACDVEDFQCHAAFEEEHAIWYDKTQPHEVEY